MSPCASKVAACSGQAMLWSTVTYEKQWWSTSIMTAALIIAIEEMHPEGGGMINRAPPLLPLRGGFTQGKVGCTPLYPG